MNRAESAVLAIACMVLAAGCNARAPAPRATPAAELASPTPKPPPTPIPIEIHAHRQGARYIYFTQLRRGRKLYVIRADANEIVRSQANQGRSTFVNPHVTFYQTGGKTLVADAPRAVVSEADHSIAMSGGVHARTSDGATLQCDTLVYDERSQRIHGTGHVHFVGTQGESATGSRIDANTELTEIRMTAGAAHP
ncbi:MAG: LPS export ABC transporter periplasmic protein LptC [Vulcanimicrobiaceae bacterium]